MNCHNESELTHSVLQMFNKLRLQVRNRFKVSGLKRHKVLRTLLETAELNERTEKLDVNSARTNDKMYHLKNHSKQNERKKPAVCETLNCRTFTFKFYCFKKCFN